MTQETLDRIIEMLEASPYHSKWSAGDIDDLILTPIRLSQYVLGVNDDESLFFFASFATPEEQHIQEYCTTGRFPVEGFYADGDDVWIIDFVCYGGKRDITQAFRNCKILLSYRGYDRCFWLRTEKMKLGFYQIKE